MLVIPEARGAIEASLDQTPGARENLRRGIQKVRRAATATVGATAATAIVDLRAGIAVGIIGLGAVLVDSLESTMPYIDSMIFENPNKKPETTLEEGIPTQIS